MSDTSLYMARDCFHVLVSNLIVLAGDLIDAINKNDTTVILRILREIQMKTFSLASRIDFASWCLENVGYTSEQAEHYISNPTGRCANLMFSIRNS